MARSSSPASFQPLSQGMRWMLFTASALVFTVGIPLFLLFIGAGVWGSEKL